MAVVLARSYSRNSGRMSLLRLTVNPSAAKRSPSFLLVCRVDEAKEQADRNMLKLSRLDFANDVGDFLVAQRLDDFAAGIHALFNGEPVFRRRDRRGTIDVQRVEPRAILPADKEHVAETFGGDEGDRLAGSLEQRVGGDSRAVNHTNIGKAIGNSGDGFDHRFMKLGRTGRDFHDAQPAGRGIEGDQIGKRAADVNADVQDCGLFALMSGHRIAPMKKRWAVLAISVLSVCVVASGCNSHQPRETVQAPTSRQPFVVDAKQDALHIGIG